ncbi:MAG: prepilin-type N-terminal cleavage/methylation domain-containing protein [Cyanobacteria bacterium P01_D01_bin.105]
MKFNQTRENHVTAGFTLIEMLVVIVMVGVLSAIAAPSWLSFLTNQRLDAVSTDLFNVLRAAQEEAQSKQQSKEVLFSSTDLTVTVRNQSASTGGVTTALGNDEVSSNFNLIASTSIVFDHDGQIDAGTAPYVVKIVNSDSSSQSCVIVTTLLGNLKSARGDECDTFNGSPI